MTLLALGINHKTAPVSLRERVSFSPDKLDQALDSLLAQPMVQGGVVLSILSSLASHKSSVR